MVTKSAFTDLRSIDKGFTAPHWMVGVSDVGKGFIDPPLFTNQLWIGHFNFFRPTNLVKDEQVKATNPYCMLK
jgi:hypothetical protein